jgi:hypothetical protein
MVELTDEGPRIGTEFANVKKRERNRHEYA